jgi:hypothetical protein
MWQECLLTSSEVPSNVSVRIAIKISQHHQTIKMGAICVRLRSNLMLDSIFSGNFTPNSCTLTLSSITFLFLITRFVKTQFYLFFAFFEIFLSFVHKYGPI